jgi:MULE transposase domain
VLHDANVWIMDGTFKVCPPGFKQLYTILAYGSFEREAVPVVFALLNGKTQHMYVELLLMVTDGIRRQYGNLGNVETVLVDFELAMHNAIRAVSLVHTLQSCSLQILFIAIYKLAIIGLARCSIARLSFSFW